MSWYLKPHDKIMRSVPKPAPQRQFLEQSAFLAQLGKVYVSTSNNNWPSSTNDSQLKDVCYVCVYIYIWTVSESICLNIVFTQWTTTLLQLMYVRKLSLIQLNDFVMFYPLEITPAALGGSYRTAFTENDNHLWQQEIIFHHFHIHVSKKPLNIL